MARLAARYASHQARRLGGRHGAGGLDRFVEMYARDGLVGIPLTARRDFASLAGCVACGQCALAVAPRDGAQIWHLPAQLTRSFPDLPYAADDAVRFEPADDRQASAVCPVGVPFAAVREFLHESLELIDAARGGALSD